MCINKTLFTETDSGGTLPSPVVQYYIVRPFKYLSVELKFILLTAQ